MVDILVYNQRMKNTHRAGIMADHDLDVLNDSPPSTKYLKRENGSATATKKAYNPEVATYNHMVGVPRAAIPTKLTAPVHIDIGGTIYTSSLEHLTKFPDSRLAKLFSGEVPIILDTMKQHYFIDRDGPSFRFVLQFLRTGKLMVPDNYSELNLLLEEARYYELDGLVEAVQRRMKEKTETMNNECLSVNISPDLGERITLSGRKSTIELIFPELRIALSDHRNSGWIRDNDYAIRFPVNGFCKLNSIEVLETVLQHGFTLISSNGGGVESQQFSDYLFTRRHN